MRLEIPLRWVLSVLVVFVSVAQADSPQVLSFSPQGVVQEIRQVRAAFSHPIVPLGSLQGQSPFEIRCQGRAQGNPRWADSQNWIFDFDRDLPAGVQCTFKLKMGLRTLAGLPLSGKQEFSFSTGMPDVVNIQPHEGNVIHEDQAFILRLNQNLDPKQLVQWVSFFVHGVVEPIPAQIIAASDRERILKSYGSQEDIQDGRVVIVQAKRPFPYEAKVTVVWGADGSRKFQYPVRKDFSAQLNCERESPEKGCVPLGNMSLSFSGSISRAQAKKIQLKDESGRIYPIQLNEQGEIFDTVPFKGPFPEKSVLHLEIPSDIKDDSDRTLLNAASFPLSVHIGEMPSLAKFSSEFGILEVGSPAILPVTIRNLEVSGQIQGKKIRLARPNDIKSVVSWFQKVGHQRQYEHRGEPILAAKGARLPGQAVESFTIQKPSAAQELEVLGIPLNQPGFYVVELASKVLGKKLLNTDKTMYVSALVLVTDLSVHFKKGNDSSLIWVTSLKDAKPTSGANVEIKDCNGKVLAKGVTDKNGLVKIQSLPQNVARCYVKDFYSPYANGLFVTAEKGSNFAFAHTHWDRGIETWRYNLPYEYDHVAMIAHTVTDRSLFRVGDTVHMRHWVRRHSNQGITSISPQELPQWVQIEHQGSGQKYQIPVRWQADQTAEMSWKIPMGSKLGSYGVSFLGKTRRYPQVWQSGKFRVEEYQVPLMTGVIQLPSVPQISPDQLAVDLSVRYLAGGGAQGLPLQFRYQQVPFSSKAFSEFEKYVFSNGPVHEGVFTGGDYEEASSVKYPLMKQSLNLGKEGSTRVVLQDLKKMESVGSVSLEIEFQDPNGETQTSSSFVPVYPSKTLIGLHSEHWSYSQDAVQVDAAVVDLKGKPLVGAPVEIQFYSDKYYSHRKKVVGGFYSYENRREIKKINERCVGITNQDGIFRCKTALSEAGGIILQAKTTDDHGNVSTANRTLHVHGSRSSWFTQEDHERINLIPQKKRYEAGEKAVFQVEMPFRKATAWVTVEREGVLDSFLVDLDSQKPLIEVPIRKNYAPNVFISAFVIRGRLGDVQPTALIDLGKPAYKLGITEVQVGWMPHELKVKVTSDQEVYHVRDRAQVKIQVKPASGGKLTRESDVVIAAVDEGLLALASNESWNLLESMMTRRGYAVSTYTAQAEIIGKRHFGLKAVPQGGGGGFSPTRDLFEPLLFWKARVPLDKNGEALIEIPLNDSITSFRIVAIARSGMDQFGTGSTSIRSTQDLMILSGIPPVVREGDQFTAEFTLRNTTQTPMQVEVQGTVSGVNSELSVKNMNLAPGESKVTSWNVQVPANVSVLKYEIRAHVKNSLIQDGLRISQKVIGAVPVQVYQATLAQLDPSRQFDVEMPKTAIRGKGSIDVVLQPSLLAGLSGVKDYMSQYSYDCLEQKVSKAIALRDEKLWNQVMKELPSYVDSEGLVRYFPSDHLNGSDTLTSYLLSISDEAKWKIPDLQQERMINGLKKFVNGSLSRKNVTSTSDLAIRKIAALEALSRKPNFDGGLLSLIDKTPNSWPTSAVIDFWNILNRVKDLKEREGQLTELQTILQARLNFQGSRIGFSTETRDRMDWLMVSGDVNVNRFVLSLIQSKTWTHSKEDIPRLVKGSLDRQVRGHWDTTPANAWGVLALERFNQNYEKSQTHGITSISLSSKTIALDWAKDSHGKRLSLPWPKNRGELKIEHSGEGKPWVTVQTRAAIPVEQAMSSGLKISKSWVPVEQKKSGQWCKGDLIRVRLEVESQMDSTWVALTDPIPAGASILGSGLGNASALLTQEEKSTGSAWPVFEERSFESYRVYYERVPKGSWTLEYTIRLNQSGKMNLPSTRIEALYSPEVFGEIPNENKTIQN
jgi:uncharacterized protein YfaS (alpha-2-macroglobulin family)